MLDKKKAFEILGLGKNASRNDIERRYSILLKRHRMASAEGQEDSETINIDEVTQAYNLLMGYVEPETAAKAPNPLLQKVGIDEKKAGNFFHYYKVHIIIGIIALLVIGYTVKGCVERVDPDFSIAFLGKIFYTETDALKAEIKQQIPEIKEPGFDGAFIDSSGEVTDGQQEYAMRMKAMVLMAAADVDLFIIDKANLEVYIEQGAFISLDDAAKRLGQENNADRLIKGKTEEDTQEHIYGIDISNSTVLKNCGIIGEEVFAAIPVRGKQPEKAEKVIELLLK